jgi:hypothetical protein
MLNEECPEASSVLEMGNRLVKLPSAEGRRVVVIEAAVDESVAAGVTVGLRGKALVWTATVETVSRVLDRRQL